MGTRAIDTGPNGERLSSTLRRLRRARNLSPDDLAARLDSLGRPMAAGVLGKIERGERRVDVDDLVALAAALDVNPSTLLLPSSSDDAPTRLTPEREVPAWAAWQWMDGYAPLPSGSEEDGYNTPAEFDDFLQFARPAERRRHEAHPLIRASRRLQEYLIRLVDSPPRDRAGVEVRRGRVRHLIATVDTEAAELLDGA